MDKTALITGITGQLGSYLAEMLQEKGYSIVGMVRRNSSVTARARIDHLNGIKLLYGDLQDPISVSRIIEEIQPDEIYNLGAQSHVRVSFDMPDYTHAVNAIGPLTICNAAHHLKKPVKIYQASTSELYGGIYNHPVSEKTPFHPRSPYAIAKLSAFCTMVNYREAYDMFCVNGIVFNSESPRRGENFVTKKITRGIASIVNGKDEFIRLGNLNARRDWNHAKDTVRAMHMILQASEPEDYVIASGKSHSIRELAETAFKYADIDLKWRGSGLEEEGYNSVSGKALIKIDPIYFRPSEVNILIGDASKAKEKLGWAPEHTFEELVEEMVRYDLDNFKR